MDIDVPAVLDGVEVILLVDQFPGCVLTGLLDVCYHGRPGNTWRTLTSVSLAEVMTTTSIIDILLAASQKGVNAVHEPEGHYCHRFCTAIAPFWFSMEHLLTVLMPFWLSTDY